MVPASLRPRVSLLLLLSAVLGSSAGTAKPNVLLLSIDTLRADALHAYGSPLETTPTIDGLAARGVLFEDTLTTIGKTGPAMASLFTSLSPPSHGARRNGIPMRPDVPTLAEVLKTAGYDTAAFISNWTLRSGLAEVDRGFDHYDQEFDSRRNIFGARERTADAVLEASLSWLDRRGEDADPLFLWVHLTEPHTPYDLHAGVSVPRPQPADRSDGWDKRWRYANEVAFTDQAVRRLLEGLAERIDLDDTLIVFVADHGESLGEHGYWGHGKNTNWPNLRIPLILAGPGVPTGRRVAGPAMITDVFPTLLELLAIPAPEGADQMEGLSLRRGWAEGLPADRLRFTLGDRHTAWGARTRRNYEDPKEISLQSTEVKVVYDFASRSIVYYDLATDPSQLRPLTSPPSEIQPPWRRRLANWYRSLPKYESSTGEISEEDRKQLESLGYVGAP